MMSNAEKLPDCYQKGRESNNYKLLELNRMAVRELKEDIGAVLEALDLNLAVGKTLDLYGDMLKQRRGLLNDEQYRYMLFSKIGQNIVQGDYESIMDTLVLMFGSQMGDITLDDLELTEEDRPCVVKLTKFPVYVLIKAGFSSRQAVAMIEALLPICVTLSADNFEGTFEFSEEYGDYDENAGFGDPEQLTGGYLGLFLGDDDTIPILPV